MSYLFLKQSIDGYLSTNTMVGKYKGEFREQMPNFSTKDEIYPVVFFVPISSDVGMNTSVYSFDFYAVDILLKDRSNIDFALNDTRNILEDLFNHFFDDIIDGIATFESLNNFDLDYVVGWKMSVNFEIVKNYPCG